jgi:DNA-binding MarR family transcriptional regulator
MAHAPGASDCLCLSIRRLSRLVTQAYDEGLSAVGLTINQFSLLRALSIAGDAGFGLKDLARTLDMDPSTLTRSLQPLLRDGLVRLAVGEDRRERRGFLTAAGKRRMEAAMPIWNSTQKSVRRTLGAEADPQLQELIANARRL